MKTAEMRPLNGMAIPKSKLENNPINIILVLIDYRRDIGQVSFR